MIQAAKPTIEIPHFAQPLSDEEYDVDDEKAVFLAGGGTVPKVAVNALDELDKKWPGASFPMARAAIVWAVLDAVTNDNKGT